MTTQEAIEAVINEDVSCDIHGDLYGVDRAAEYIAGVIDEKCARIEALEKALQQFVAFYPMGISLELDEAFREARTTLGEKKND